MMRAVVVQRSFMGTTSLCTPFAAAGGCAGVVVAGCSLLNAPEPSIVPGGEGGIGGAAQRGGGAGGGPECTAATVAQDCGASSDCQAYSCESGSCKAALAVRNTPCTDAPGDEVCDGRGECVPPTGTDAGLNGKETDVDCGGIDCGACDNGKLCSGGIDCHSGQCAGTQGGSGGSGGASAGGSGGTGSGGTDGAGDGVPRGLGRQLRPRRDVHRLARHRHGP